MQDSKIIKLFFARNEDAVAQVSEKYGAYCRSIADRILVQQTDAEECVNDTWLQAWSSIPPKQPLNLKLYLARITRNLALNRRQAELAAKRSALMTEALDELADCLPAGETAESIAEADELKDAVNRFLETLPRRERNVFLRRYFFVETAEEIGDRYGLTAANVATILFRTRKALKAHLTKEGYL